MANYKKRAKSAPKILYIAEGEIEEKFLDFLKQRPFIKAGAFAKFNLMQNKLKPSDNLLKKQRDEIYCILDTDCLERTNVDKLLDNLKLMRDIGLRKIFLLIQNKNFEDELSYVLNCRDLCKFFRLPHSSKKDLKEHLAQFVRYNECVTKEDLPRYCSRHRNFTQELAMQKRDVKSLKIVEIKSCML